MLIEYKNVSIYQADKCILKDVNFHVDEGEFTYLIGKVGSGKSSLLKTLYCELDLVGAKCIWSNQASWRAGSCKYFRKILYRPYCLGIRTKRQKFYQDNAYCRQKSR